MLTVDSFTLRAESRTLLADVTFQARPGEVLTLMGPSGCGKSSLLHWIVGALPDGLSARGTLQLDGRRCDRLPTEQRQIGILFQDALLFPHLTVGQNLLLALPATVKGQSARRAVVDDALAQAGLTGFADRDPATLSGGQRGRASLLRALLARPRALLLDEPFSRLDTGLRADFRHWVFGEVLRLGIPVIQVTHDEQDIPPGGARLQMDQWLPDMR